MWVGAKGEGRRCEMAVAAMLGYACLCPDMFGSVVKVALGGRCAALC